MPCNATRFGPGNIEQIEPHAAASDGRSQAVRLLRLRTRRHSQEKLHESKDSCIPFRAQRRVASLIGKCFTRARAICVALTETQSVLCRGEVGALGDHTSYRIRRRRQL